MLELAHIYVAVTAAGAVLTLVLAYEARRRRSAPGSWPLTLLMLALAGWFFTYWAVWVTPVKQAQFIWQKLNFTAVLLVAPLFLGFVLDIAGIEWRRPTRIALLSIAPVAGLAMLWGLPDDVMFSGFDVRTVGHFTHYAPVPGPLFAVWLLLMYASFIASILVLIWAYSKSTGVHQTQTVIILMGVSLPFAVSIAADVARLEVPGDFDPTAFALLPSALLFFVAMSREWLLGLVFRARDLVVELMDEGVLVIDGHGHVVDANPSAARLMGLEPDEVVGTSGAAALESLQAEDGSHGSEENTALVPVHSDDGQGYAEMGITPLIGSLGDPVGTLVILRDVSDAIFAERTLQEANLGLRMQLDEIRRLQAELREQAIRDPLTNLLNRRFLDESLLAEVARADRAKTPIGLIALDIDLFKDINDSHSHQAGDAALQMVGKTLVNSVRAGDIVCRMGGDEFVVVLPGCEGDCALRRAESVRVRIAETPVISGTDEFYVTVSVGVAAYPSHGPTGEAALNTADRALYMAKESGRNRTCLFPGPC